jgi:hypothetical protein
MTIKIEEAQSCSHWAVWSRALPTLYGTGTFFMETHASPCQTTWVGTVPPKASLGGGISPDLTKSAHTSMAAVLPARAAVLPQAPSKQPQGAAVLPLRSRAKVLSRRRYAQRQPQARRICAVAMSAG